MASIFGNAGSQDIGIIVLIWPNAPEMSRSRQDHSYVASIYWFLAKKWNTIYCVSFQYAICLDIIIYGH